MRWVSFLTNSYFYNYICYHVKYRIRTQRVPKHLEKELYAFYLNRCATCFSDVERHCKFETRYGVALCKCRSFETNGHLFLQPASYKAIRCRQENLSFETTNAFFTVWCILSDKLPSQVEMHPYYGNKFWL